MTTSEILKTDTLKSSIKAYFSFLKDCKEKYFIKYKGNKLNLMLTKLDALKISLYRC